MVFLFINDLGFWVWGDACGFVGGKMRKVMMDVIPFIMSALAQV